MTGRDTGLGSLANATRTLRSTMAEVQGGWSDAAAVAVRQRYLAPLGDASASLVAALQRQVDDIEVATTSAGLVGEAVVEAQGHLDLAGEARAQVDLSVRAATDELGSAQVAAAATAAALDAVVAALARAGATCGGARPAASLRARFDTKLDRTPEQQASLDEAKENALRFAVGAAQLGLQAIGVKIPDEAVDRTLDVALEVYRFRDVLPVEAARVARDVPREAARIVNELVGRVRGG